MKAHEIKAAILADSDLTEAGRDELEDRQYMTECIIAVQRGADIADVVKEANAMGQEN